MVLQGARRKPTKGQSMNDFFNALTHLHLSGLGIDGDLEPLKICPSLTVLYVYDNKLTTLSGLKGLRKLTHLYAQNNDLSDMSDFIVPPALEQLHLNGNRIEMLTGLETAPHLLELNLGGQRLAGVGSESEGSDALQLRFEQRSLWTIAHSLRTLDLSSCGITDLGLAALVVLQSMRSLDVTRNALSSVVGLQQLLLRLPSLCHLKIAGNPLTKASK